MAFVENFIFLFTESAPYLLLGMLLAGLIHQLVPKNWVERALGKSSSVFTAAVIGAPLPLCSCSVIPVAMGIRRSGASKASTTSFLVATPETGVDSIGITYALMGPVMALVRPLAAIFSAITAGLIVKYFASEAPEQPVTSGSGGTCCGSNKRNIEHASFVQRLQSAVGYGYGQLLRDFMSWLLIGLFFAALIQTFVPAGFIADYGRGLGAMLLVTFISIPMYICATASTPIAVGLMLSGISPGAALVFMLAGPATNIATLMVVKKELGSRELGLYLVAVVGSAMTAGLVLDLVFDHFAWSLALSMGEHGEMLGFIYSGSAVVLAALIAYQYLRLAKARFVPALSHS